MSIQKLIVVFAFSVLVSSISNAQANHPKCDVSNEQIQQTLSEQIDNGVKEAIASLDGESVDWLEMVGTTVTKLQGDVSVRSFKTGDFYGPGRITTVNLENLIYEVHVPGLEGDPRYVYQLVPVLMDDKGITDIIYGEGNIQHIGLRLTWIGDIYGTTIGCRIYTESIGFELINMESGLKAQTDPSIQLWDSLIVKTDPVGN